MPTPSKIDLDELNVLLGKGMTVRQLAEHFSCSPAAIVQAKKKLKAGVVRQAALVSHQIVSRHGDVVSRLQRSLDGFERDLDDSLDLFEQATTIQDKAMALRARTDIRDKVGKQVSRIVETLRFMGDWQLMTTFISEVLTTNAGNKTLSLLAKLLHHIVRRQMADVTVRTHSREGVRKMQRLGLQLPMGATIFVPGD